MSVFFLAAMLVCVQPPVLDLAADTNRDGVISFNQQEQNAEAINSIIVLNNCDNDNPDVDKLPDNQDGIINGEMDRRDLEPVLIRRLGPLPAGAKVFLEIALRAENALPFDDEIELLDRFRVFDNGGTEIIGRETKARYELSKRELLWLVHDALVVYVEGLQFRTSVELALYLDDDLQDSLILETAPFILMPHNLPTLENFVVESGVPAEVFKSKEFIHHFSGISLDNGIQPKRFLSRVGDLWIQDECSWGYTQTPRKTMPVVLHMLRQNSFGIPTELAEDVRGLIGHDVGYFKAFEYPPVSTTLDIGGNLEVTPPTDLYPWGRVYYGSIESVDGTYNYINRKINPGFQTFFKRQGMQEPINLCTDWLIVGHVDELVTFVPRKNGELTMLIASPKKALEILKGLGPAQKLDSKYRDSYGVSTVGELLDLKYLGTVSISALNQEVDEKLFGLDHANPSAGSVKKTFMDALSLKSEDIIEVPILFQNYEYASGKFATVALTPSLVNLYCLEWDLIVPKQFLTSFETEFMQAVADLNLKVHWVDDWDLYHTGFGEIHCGSNSRRDVFNGKWWEK